MCAFSLTFEATAVTRLRGARQENPPICLELGLLTKPPTSDGGDFEELNAPGYERQSLTFVPFSSASARGALRNMQPAEFELGTDERPDIAWVGLFDANGRITHYGRLKKTLRSPYSDAWVVEAMSGQISYRPPC